jgi:cytidine deaminase
MEPGDDIVEAAIQAAREARKTAYAPYSGFKMGAAVVTETGSIIRGTLIENVSLGLSMCSERVALFSARVQSEDKPKVLVLSSPTTDGELTWPCGACLQVASELAGPDLLIVATNDTDTASARLSELAPRVPSKSS